MIAVGFGLSASHENPNKKLLQELFAMEDIFMMSNFAKSRPLFCSIWLLWIACPLGGLTTYLPELYKKYVKLMKELVCKDPSLKLYIEGLLWAMLSVNFLPFA